MKRKQKEIKGVCHYISLRQQHLLKKAKMAFKKHFFFNLTLLLS